MASWTEARETRNKILAAILCQYNEIFAIAQIRDLTNLNRDQIRDIIYRLKQMSYLIRHRNGYHYKVWQRTSLMPSDLKTLVENYEESILNRQSQSRGRKRSDYRKDY